jgi:hypothetical protein
MYIAVYGPPPASEVSIAVKDSVTDGRTAVFYLDYAFTQVGAWNVSVWITNGVSEIWSAPYMVGGCSEQHRFINQIYVACRPTNMSIAMAYFSYGKNNNNGTTNPLLWMPANQYSNSTQSECFVLSFINLVQLANE